MKLPRVLQQAVDCEPCRKRREAIVAWQKAVAAWTLRPFGPMPAPPVEGLTLVEKTETVQAPEKSENKA